jgi:uncharacterized membrane protein
MVPLLYAVPALVAGTTVPRLEGHLFPTLVSPMSTASATAIYSSIASGMIALTGIVFSLTFVMVQFSATAYSPRLVLWIARDTVMSNALGVFAATFLYAVAALAGVDRSHSGTVPFLSVWIVLGLLLASVGMFVALLHRIGLLQVNRMLIFTGDQGRKVIKTLYAPLGSAPGCVDPGSEEQLPVTLTVMHRGRPRAVQSMDVERLVELARRSDSVIEAVSAVGDTVVDTTPLLLVRNGEKPASEAALRGAITLGDGRTFEQDPKYALRLLVDIAIKALSPAINDPTTAVQALDQIQDLLLRLGRSQLEVGRYSDIEGKLRVIIRFPAWEDFLRLAFDEIRSYGCSSVQVTRRMKAVISDLIAALPAPRHEALLGWEKRLDVSIGRSFGDLEEQREASTEDRQGLGIPRKQRAAA